MKYKNDTVDEISYQEEQNNFTDMAENTDISNLSFSQQPEDISEDTEESVVDNTQENIEDSFDDIPEDIESEETEIEESPDIPEDVEEDIETEMTDQISETTCLDEKEVIEDGLRKRKNTVDISAEKNFSRHWYWIGNNRIGSNMFYA